MNIYDILDGGNNYNNKYPCPAPLTTNDIMTDNYIALQPTGVIEMGNEKDNVMKIKKDNKFVTLQSSYVKKNLNNYVSGDDSCSSKPIQMDSLEHFGNKHIVEDQIINDFIKLYIIITLIIFLLIIINK